MLSPFLVKRPVRPLAEHSQKPPQPLDRQRSLLLRIDDGEHPYNGITPAIVCLDQVRSEEHDPAIGLESAHQTWMTRRRPN